MTTQASTAVRNRSTSETPNNTQLVKEIAKALVVGTVKGAPSRDGEKTDGNSDSSSHDAWISHA